MPSVAGFVSLYLVGWISEKKRHFDYGLAVIAGNLFLGVALVLAGVPTCIFGGSWPSAADSG